MFVCNKHDSCIVLFEDETLCPVCKKIKWLESQIDNYEYTVDGLAEKIDRIRDEIKEKDKELIMLRKRNETLSVENFQLKDRANGLIV